MAPLAGILEIHNPGLKIRDLVHERLTNLAYDSLPAVADSLWKIANR